jgi:hypothetical protein
MLKRMQEYQAFTTRVRKVFSEVQKRQIACKQQYKCVGVRCKGRNLLPSVWELDHIEPLFVLLERYTTYLPRLFHPEDWVQTQEDTTLPAFLQDLDSFIEYCSRPANVQIICARCHALKTQQERVAFYENERLHKFKTQNTAFIPASLYYTPPTPPPPPPTKIRTSRFFKKKKKKNDNTKKRKHNADSS